MGVFLQDGVSDVYISGMKDRNRALNGDIVVVQVNTRDQWKVSLITVNTSYTYFKIQLPVLFSLQRVSMQCELCNMMALGMNNQEFKQ